MTQIQKYTDDKGEFRWRLVSKNGRIIADSAEGYKTRQGLTKAVTGFQKAVKGKLKIIEIKPIPAPVPEFSLVEIELPHPSTTEDLPDPA